MPSKCCDPNHIGAEGDGRTINLRKAACAFSLYRLSLRPHAGFNFDGGVPGTIDWHSEPRLSGKRDGQSSSQHLRAGIQEPHSAGGGPPSKDGATLEAAANGGAGGLVTKTISVQPAEVPRPCMAEIRGGFLNTELWSELSERAVDRKRVQTGARHGLPVIVGLGYTAAQIRELAPLVKPFADALELSTHYVGNNITPIIDALCAAKEAVDVPVFMKLSPHPNIQEIALALEEAGADALVMINSFGPCLGIDLETGLPLMGSKDGFGWLSGAAIKPLALRCVYDAARAVKIPVIGVGGVSNGRDAAEMLMAGASAVQVCTEAILRGPRSTQGLPAS